MLTWQVIESLNVFGWIHFLRRTRNSVGQLLSLQCPCRGSTCFLLKPQLLNGSWRHSSTETPSGFTVRAERMLGAPDLILLHRAPAPAFTLSMHCSGAGGNSREASSPVQGKTLLAWWQLPAALMYSEAVEACCHGNTSVSMASQWRSFLTVSLQLCLSRGKLAGKLWLGLHMWPV